MNYPDVRTVRKLDSPAQGNVLTQAKIDRPNRRTKPNRAIENTSQNAKLRLLELPFIVRSHDPIASLLKVPICVRQNIGTTPVRIERAPILSALRKFGSI